MPTNCAYSTVRWLSNAQLVYSSHGPRQHVIDLARLSTDAKNMSMTQPNPSIAHSRHVAQGLECPALLAHAGRFRNLYGVTPKT